MSQNFHWTPDGLSGNSGGFLPPEDPRLQEPINFLLVEPAFMRANIWAQTQAILDKDNNSLAPGLRADDPTATFETDVDTLEAAVEGTDKIYIVATSRGADPALRLRERLQVRGELERVTGTTLVCSAGSYAFRLSQDMSRYTRGYKEVIDSLKTTDNGLQEIPSEIGKRYFLNDVDEAHAEEIARGFEPQRAISIAERQLPLLKPEGLEISPVRWVAGKYDLVHNMLRQILLAKEIFGIDIEIIDSGHAPYISQPQLMGELLLRHGHEAQLARIHG